MLVKKLKGKVKLSKPNLFEFSTAFIIILILMLTIYTVTSGVDIGQFPLF